MPDKICYVLGGYGTPDQLAPRSDGPTSEFNHFVKLFGADLVSLSTSQISAGLKGRFKGSLKLSQVITALSVAARAGRYRAIIASGEDIGVPLGLAFQALGVKIPLVIITHGFQLGSRTFAALFRHVVSQPNVRAACLSESLRGAIISRFGVNADHCVNAGYGVDTDFFQPQQRETEVMIASAGVSNRDYPTLLKAVTGLDIDVRIAAASSWVSTPNHSNLLKPSNVEMRSYGNYANLRDLYARARLVVVPINDAAHASGMAVIGEAAAMGKPVIASNGVVVSDFVIDGESGVLVAAGDADQLRASIVGLLDDAPKRSQLGQSAAIRMRAYFSLDQYCHRLEALTRLQALPFLSGATS